jgi:hypothetical protein
MERTNTLAYYNSVTIIAFKSFIEQVLGFKDLLAYLASS